MLRIIDLFLAVMMLVVYLSFLVFIIVMTRRILTSGEDKILTVHFKSKYSNWLFIVEPLIEWK
jgi:uncharacterized membrane protein YqiK